jgi:hypothetical protein
MLPNFFLVGAAKAGTTSLYNYLSQHPQIYMSPIKEPNYFAGEVRIENFAPEFHEQIRRWQSELRMYLDGPRTGHFTSGPVADWDDYLRLFEPAGGQIAVGEASPTYLWSPTAPMNIRSRCPEARILMILRNPVDRAFAQHMHTLSVSRRPMTLREHITAALGTSERKIGELYPFLEFGLYANQVERYLSVFGRARVMVRLYDDFVADPSGLLREIFIFLGVDAEFRPDTRMRHMTARVPRSLLLNRLLPANGVRAVVAERLPGAVRRKLRSVLFRDRSRIEMPPSDREFLASFYRSDIERLSRLLDFDLRCWTENQPCTQ